MRSFLLSEKSPLWYIAVIMS